MSVNLEQAAAQFLNMLTQGAQTVGQHTPELIMLAGTYLQIKAIIATFTILISLALVVYIGYVVWKKLSFRDNYGYQNTNVGVARAVHGFSCFLMLVILINVLPGSVVSSLDPKLALTVYVMENIKR